MDFLFDKAQLRKRIDKVYSAMKHQAKPKLWKNGPKRGKVHVPGLEHLPFTSQQLWDWTVEWIGPGAIRCPYCEEIGRNAFIISIENCVFDHHVSKVRGGLAAWEMHNLIPVCADCNNLKGSMSYEFFVKLIRQIETVADILDRAYLYKCLRTHGVALQMQRGKPKLVEEQQSTQPEAMQLALDNDDF